MLSIFLYILSDYNPLFTSIYILPLEKSMELAHFENVHHGSFLFSSKQTNNRWDTKHFLLYNMPEKIKAVIKSQGWATKY